VLLSDHRDAASARALFEQASTSTEVTPTRVTTDKAKWYPPALRAVLLNAQHRSSPYLNNGLKRDHQHLKEDSTNALVQVTGAGGHVLSGARAHPEFAAGLRRFDRRCLSSAGVWKVVGCWSGSGAVAQPGGHPLEPDMHSELSAGAGRARVGG
jgi:hypothetical protein